MALEFYLSTNGSDDNGGSSEAVIVSGANATTDGTATVQLPGSTDLSGVNQGATHDTIRIAGRSDGLNSTDIFEITAVDDGNDQVTVTPSPGAGNNQDWCIGGAWLSPQKAMNVVSAGDHVWMKADGAYESAGDSGCCAKYKQRGTAANPITFEGYKTTPGDADTARSANPDKKPADSFWDDYRAKLDGNAQSLTWGIKVDGGGGQDLHYVFKNIWTTRFSGPGFDLGGSLEGHYAPLKNCRSNLNAVGLYTSSYAPALPCEFCCFDNNTALGAQGGVMLTDCDVCNNGVGGLKDVTTGSASIAAIGCRLFGNGGDVIDAQNTDALIVQNCTFDGDGKPAGKAAIYSPPPASTVVNNIFHDFDTAIDAVTDPGERVVVRNNLFTNNNTDRNNFPVGMGDKSADDPGFVDEENNDYRLTRVSPALNAGYPRYADVGAEQGPSVDAGEVHLVKAVLCNKVTWDTSTGVLTVYDADGTTALATITPSEADGVVTLAPEFPHSPAAADVVAAMHLAKAALLNARTHTIDTGIDEIKDDDGETTLRTLTPSESNGVVTVTPS